MIKVAHAQLWVHDQDEALAFYTQKLGWQVHADVTIAELGNFRWLAVGPVGQDEFSVVLMAIPGPPVFDEDTKAQIEALTAKGATSAVFIVSDDVRAEFEELKGRGVEFIDEPEERPYGIDCGFRDPSGNHMRLTQPNEVVA